MFEFCICNQERCKINDPESGREVSNDGQITHAQTLSRDNDTDAIAVIVTKLHIGFQVKV